MIQVQCAEGAPLKVVRSRHAAAVVHASAVTTADWHATLTQLWSQTRALSAAVGDAIRTPAVVHVLVVAAVITVVVLLAWLVARLLLTRRALDPKRRVRLLVLPTETFDPTEEEVDRYAAQLARTRRSVRWLTGPSAHAVRLRLDSVGDGQCAYHIEGSARAASILRQSGFDEVELRPAEDASSAAARPAGLATPDDVGDAAAPQPPDEGTPSPARRTRDDLEEPAR